jgi:hypothetical protein
VREQIVGGDGGESKVHQAWGGQLGPSFSFLEDSRKKANQKDVARRGTPGNELRKIEAIE